MGLKAVQLISVTLLKPNFIIFFFSRNADKKAAIGYVYEDSTESPPRLNNASKMDDDEEENEEEEKEEDLSDIDLGKALLNHLFKQ